MALSPVREDPSTPGKSPLLLVILAFAIIYIVWGSTYFAIRIAVAEAPPLLAAGIRFLVAGSLLLVWSRARGAPSFSRLEWRNLLILGALMFLMPYGGLFWAERSLPSGIASVLVATIPMWTALLEIFVTKREVLRWQLVMTMVLGFGGVGLLAAQSMQGSLAVLPCLAVIGSEISWSIGMVSAKSMRLPASKTASAGAQMTIGGVLLLACSLLAGELSPIPQISGQAWLAIAYLTVAGSLVAFTAFVWLLARMPATHVSSYAYVNPVIALAVGHWLGHEVIDRRVVLGTALVLLSIVLILGRPVSQRATAQAGRALAEAD
jgi:drug/metabolite transporter (DMT)-like permease